MKLEFGYGRGKQQAEISERNLLGILKPNVIRAERSQEDEVQYALEQRYCKARGKNCSDYQ